MADRQHHQDDGPRRHAEQRSGGQPPDIVRKLSFVFGGYVTEGTAVEPTDRCHLDQLLSELIGLWHQVIKDLRP